jgi:hypothetical protein
LQPADLAQPPILPGDRRFPRSNRTQFPRQNRFIDSSTLLFSGTFSAFHRTATKPMSTTCEDDIHVAQAKDRVSSLPWKSTHIATSVDRTIEPQVGYIIDFDWGGIQAASLREIFFQQLAACGRRGDYVLSTYRSR